MELLFKNSCSVLNKSGLKSLRPLQFSWKMQNRGQGRCSWGCARPGGTHLGCRMALPRSVPRPRFDFVFWGAILGFERSPCSLPPHTGGNGSLGAPPPVEQWHSPPPPRSGTAQAFISGGRAHSRPFRAVFLELVRWGRAEPGSGPAGRAGGAAGLACPAKRP